jgi:hypothetical protein
MVSDEEAVAVGTVTVPRKVVVLVPAAEPMIIVCVDPGAPLIPMFTLLVTPLGIAPDPTLMVDAAVELPKVRVVPEKVFVAPEKTLLPEIVLLALRDK